MDNNVYVANMFEVTEALGRVEALLAQILAVSKTPLKYESDDGRTIIVVRVSEPQTGEQK